MKRTLLAITMLVGSSAQAEFFDGNTLHQRLNGNHSEQMMAMGYVVGVFDAHRSNLICPTSTNITTGQVADIVRNYLDRYPQHRHYTGDMLTTIALASVWPCKNQNQNNGRGGSL